MEKNSATNEIIKQSKLFEKLMQDALKVQQKIVELALFIALGKDILSVKKVKDHSKYVVNNLPPQGKGRTAYSIVKNSVKMKPGLTSENILNMFPAELAGNRKAYKVIVPLSQAEKVFTDEGRSRYYTKPEDVIVLVDGSKWAVSTQWNKTNIVNMLKKAKDLNIPVRKLR